MKSMYEVWESEVISISCFVGVLEVPASKRCLVTYEWTVCKGSQFHGSTAQYGFKGVLVSILVVSIEQLATVSFRDHHTRLG